MEREWFWFNTASQGGPELEYCSALKRNEVRLFVDMWVGLEFVIQSEVSQKEKNKSHLLMHIHAVQRMVQMYLGAGQERRCRWENGHVDTGWGRMGRLGLTYNTTMCKRDNPWECCCKRVFVLTSVFSWQNSVSLCPASFCTPRVNLPVTPGISWLPTFAFQSLMMKRTSFLVLSLEGL